MSFLPVFYLGSTESQIDSWQGLDHGSGWSTQVDSRQYKNKIGIIIVLKLNSEVDLGRA